MNGKYPQIVDKEPKYDLHEIVSRAKSQIGKKEYEVRSKNCEHFASWCVEGKARSNQVINYGFSAISIIAISAIAAILGIMKFATNPWENKEVFACKFIQI